ncbi:Zn-dependent protease with chaperone function [Micromonospora phaseoli]|uniref:Zn-dependent protease with chaperone function n=1 Tax=Micromonospora phaseoli TaxID=1144548 RepID=A0A1H6T020_9ACTN|nr:M48 family metallopeptidase [Micromonospora phaseoli]PZW04043.1 Zn-dependent protease with chaperone function [Micromonospora phaseoli]GIJ81381.1 Zn-dependent protease [Micromonospora phaseoli]SEI69590.1 Zn-dependent protease with chaperone function [Micromonospora phaseoli]
MNFFERQRQVRRLSTRLVLLFVLAVVGIVVVVNLAAVFAFNATSADPGQLAGFVVMVTIATVAAIGLAALVRTLALRGGGGKVARELGGVPVPTDTTDPELRRLRNVVEEMALASGVPVPEVYILPEETAINAFAAGWSTSDAAVAVTRGALQRLNRDELQGVIAHEFSHVVNGDMRLNIRLMGLLFGILFLTVIGRGLARAGVIGGGRSRDNSSSAAPLALVGLALLVAGYVGVLAGRLIQASVSRQREYLADASAVQYTRQTSGIAGALKKIGGLTDGSELKSPKRDEVGHMLFGEAARTSWFATHPPLTDRIRALEPSFDPAELRQLAQRWSAAPPSGRQEDVALGLAPAGPAAGQDRGAAPQLPVEGTRVRVAPTEVLGRVAAPTETAYTHAAAIIDRIPDPLLDRARRRDSAGPLLLGLLLSAEPPVRQQQYAALTERHGRELADAAVREAETLAGLHPMLRLPLAELAFPALRDRPDAEVESLLAAVFTLIHADGAINVSEYCLSRLLLAELEESLRPDSRWRPDRRTLTDSRSAAAHLLAILAQVGHAERSAAEQAFQAGVATLLPGTNLPYAPPENGVLALETAWPVLDGLRPADKERLVAATVAVISHDGMMTVPEIELLRTICGLLHCPLPPMAGGGTG